MLLKREVVCFLDDILPVDFLLLVEGIDVLDEGSDDKCQLVIISQVSLAANRNSALWTLLLAAGQQSIFTLSYCSSQCNCSRTYADTSSH